MSGLHALPSKREVTSHEIGLTDTGTIREAYMEDVLQRGQTPSESSVAAWERNPLPAKFVVSDAHCRNDCQSIDASHMLHSA